MERHEVTVVRYAEIAETIATIALEEPPVFDGDEGTARVRTALLLASIASYESHYAARVDDCRVSRGGALGLWQTVAPRAKVCTSRVSAAHLALAMVRQSFTVCAKYEELDRLGFYTDGVCHRDWGRSRWRVGRAVRWWRKFPPPAPTPLPPTPAQEPEPDEVALAAPAAAATTP